VGDQLGGSLGSCVAIGGHADGPGPADVIASSFYDPDQTGYNRGRVSVFANSNSPTSVSPGKPIAGLTFVGARPNPASNDVNLVLDLDHSVPVRIRVYDLAGHEVARPIAEEWMLGRVSRAWRDRGLSRVGSITCERSWASASRYASWCGSGIEGE